jgi:hypothetical protein
MQITEIAQPRGGSPSPDRRRFGFVAAVAGIALLALLARLPSIAEAPLWTDEIATWTFAGLGWSDLLGPIAAVEPNPPGFYLLVKLIEPAGGHDAATLRLPSVIAGALAVVPLAFLTRGAFGTAAGLLTAALLAISAEHIHHAQQARGYALLFLATATALWLLRAVLRPDLAAWRRGLVTLGFAGASLVMLHLHATATIAVAALYVHAAGVLAARLAWRTGSRRGLAAVLVALAVAGVLILLGAAWWLRLAVAMAAEPAGPLDWIAPPDLAWTGSILVDLLGGFHLGRLKALVAVIAGGALVLAAVLAVRRRSPHAVGLLAGFVFGVAALHGISQVKPILLDRTALFLLVFALPLIAFALTSLRPRLVGAALAAVLLLLSARGALTRAEAFAAEGFREDWRGAVAALARAAQPGDLVVLTNPPDSGALPFHAPGLAERLRLRAVVVEGDRLGAALMARLPHAAPVRPAELCGGEAWVLARETPWEPEEVTPWLFAGPEIGRFGEVKLRRTALPPC